MKAFLSQSEREFVPFGYDIKGKTPHKVVLRLCANRIQGYAARGSNHVKDVYIINFARNCISSARNKHILLSSEHIIIAIAMYKIFRDMLLGIGFCSSFHFVISELSCSSRRRYRRAVCEHPFRKAKESSFPLGTT